MLRTSLDTTAHIGQRDKLITIERQKDTLAASNFPGDEWGQSYVVWASREYVSLDERVQSSQLMASAVIRWEVPYTADLDPDRSDIAKTRRVKHLGRVHNIIAAEMRSREQGQAIVLTTQAQVG